MEKARDFDGSVAFFQSFPRAFFANKNISVAIDESQTDKVEVFSDGSGFVVRGYSKQSHFECKGCLDSAISVKAYQNNNLYEQFVTTFETKTEISLFKMLSYYRCEQILSSVYLGCKNNILRYNTHKIDNLDFSKHQLIEVIVMSCLYNRKNTIYKLANHSLKNQIESGISSLVSFSLNEKEFYEKAYKLVKDIILAHPATDNKSSEKIEEQTSKSTKKQATKQDDNAKDENEQQTQNDEDLERMMQNFLQNKNNDKTPAVSEDFDRNDIDKNSKDGGFTYKVFTKAFDKAVKITKLSTSKQEDDLLKKDLLLEAKESGKVNKRQIQKLITKLLSLEKITLNFNKSDGIIDRKKFTKIFSGSVDGEMFFTREEKKTSDIAVTILVDNSGSMRGSLIKISSLTCYILCQVLSRLRVSTEVLGFTTSKWQGGDSYKHFEPLAKSFELDGIKPGRVSDLLHIVYKSFLDSSNSSNLESIALMRKDSILKENIDGEALIWAYNRLLSRREKKKIMIVISDGTPVDDSTISLNGKDYLNKHLLQVIKKIETEKRINLIAFGIMHDVEKFYKNSIRIDSANELSKTIFDKITATL